MKKLVKCDGHNLQMQCCPNSKYRKPRLFDDFNYVKDPNGDLLRYESDISVILVNDSVKKFASDVDIKRAIDELTPCLSDDFSDLRSHVSDDDLLNFMKSRGCQTPSELKAWSQSLERFYKSELDKKNDELAKKNESEREIEKRNIISNWLSKIM